MSNTSMDHRQQSLMCLWNPIQLGGHPSRSVVFHPKLRETMTKPLDQIDDVIRNPKHPFRQVGDRPEKPQKHRYERRKIREYIKSGDWIPGK
jgi:hypothetical protein